MIASAGPVPRRREKPSEDARIALQATGSPGLVDRAGPGPKRSKPVNTTLQEGREETQRDGIPTGTVAAGERDGNARGNVS